MALASGGESCADDPSSWWPLHKSYYKEPILGGHAHDQVPLLAHRVIRVRQENGQWVAERGDRFVKGDAMFMVRLSRSVARAPGVSRTS